MLPDHHVIMPIASCLDHKVHVYVGPCDQHNMANMVCCLIDVIFHASCALVEVRVLWLFPSTHPHCRISRGQSIGTTAVGRFGYCCCCAPVPKSVSIKQSINEIGLKVLRFQQETPNTLFETLFSMKMAWLPTHMGLGSMICLTACRETT